MNTDLLQQIKDMKTLEAPKGYKRKIVELFKSNPQESECDLIDLLLGLEEILKEYRERYAAACVEEKTINRWVTNFEHHEQKQPNNG